MTFVFLSWIINDKFFVGLHGDKTYNTFVCGNSPGKFITAVINLRGVSTIESIIIINEFHKVIW
jgi:hypothetical protein